MEYLCHLPVNFNPDTPNMRLIRHKPLVFPTLTRRGQTVCHLYKTNPLNKNVLLMDLSIVLQKVVNRTAVQQQIVVRQIVRLFHNAVGFYLLTTSDLKWVNVRHNWSSTSTMLFSPVAKTLSKYLRV